VRNRREDPVDRLTIIQSQDALLLLRLSFSAPRVLHLLRCSSSADHPSLSNSDRIMEHSVQEINCDLSEIQRIQARLPLRDGVLGIRRVISLALPAFVASAAYSITQVRHLVALCTARQYCLHAYLSTSTQFGDIPEIDWLVIVPIASCRLKLE